MDQKDKNGRRVLPNLLNTPQEPENISFFDNENENEDDVEDFDYIVSDEEIREFREMRKMFEAADRELRNIKASRPLGSVVHREPKSLNFSEVPKPVWKRKLRP